MPSVYPRTATQKAVEALDPGTCAARIITAREEYPDASKAQLVGGVLQGSDDVSTFYRIWDEVEAERAAMATVRVADHDTLTKLNAALAAEAYHLDVATWVDGLKDQAGVSTWSELKALADEAVSAKEL